MSVKIRLTRMGKKKQPSYRVVVMDSRRPRDGAYIEQIGVYDPRREPSLIEIDNDKAVDWLRKGAQPTDRARKLLEISGAWTRFRVAKGDIHTIGEPPSGSAVPMEPATDEPPAEPVAQPADEAPEVSDELPATVDEPVTEADEGAGMPETAEPAAEVVAEVAEEPVADVAEEAEEPEPPKSPLPMCPLPKCPLPRRDAEEPVTAEETDVPEAATEPVAESDTDPAADDDEGEPK